MARQFEDALKGFLTPGRLFEDLGFTYVGPIDGHRLKHLIDTLVNVKRFRTPVLIHTVTRKGKGYSVAEQNPARFHGVGQFDRSTGEIMEASGPPTFTAVFGGTILKLARDNSRIVAVTAAMEYGTGLAEFARLYPNRFFDVGIAEQHGIVFAAGLAKEGYKPVVAIYSTFVQRGYDHLIHDVCMQKFPVIFAMDRAGVVGEDGPTHHGVFDIAFSRSIPNLIVMAPSDEGELADMLATAVACDGPCAIRYPRARGRGILMKNTPEAMPIGRARMVAEGTDVLIIAVGSMVNPSIEASAILNREGISVGVMDARFVKPLDRDLIVSKAAATGVVLTIEEGILAGGFGTSILELFSEEGLQNMITARMGIPDVFVEHGTRSELLKELGLCAEGIADKVRTILANRSVPIVRRVTVLRGGSN